MMFRLRPNKTSPAADAAQQDVLLTAADITLRPSRADDRDEWLSLRARNRAYLKPFEPAWPQDALTPAYYARRLLRVTQDWVEDRGYSFHICAREDGAIVGGMNINNVTRGAAQYATLGYWIDEGHQGRGWTAQAVRLALSFSFENLHLARVNAACIPVNERSRNVLLACGFTEEGFAKGYIQIDGVRADHILSGITLEDYLRMTR